MAWLKSLAAMWPIYDAMIALGAEVEELMPPYGFTALAPLHWAFFWIVASSFRALATKPIQDKKASVALHSLRS